MTKIFCDHCGKELGNDYNDDSINRLDVYDLKDFNPFSKITYRLELCDKCFEKFKKEWLENGSGEV